jgi:hypothetical protein
MTIDDMLDNAAAASQNLTLIDCEVTRGALLRSIHTYIERYEGSTLGDFMVTLKEHKGFEQ